MEFSSKCQTRALKDVTTIVSVCLLKISGIIMLSICEDI